MELSAQLLVIEDDHDVSEILTQILSHAGWTVRVARNGVEGLAALEERRPDGILLDLEMPLLDGARLAYAVRNRQDGLENTPIILLSGLSGLAVVAAALGTPYYLNKPCRPEVLVAAITDALEAGHAGD